jgi:hypothetical protein
MALLMRRWAQAMASDGRLAAPLRDRPVWEPLAARLAKRDRSDGRYTRYRVGMGQGGAPECRTC